MKKLLFLMVVLFIGLSAIVSAQTLPINITEFEIDGIELIPRANNYVNLERNKDVEVEVKLTPTQDIKDVDLTVFVSGYEYSDFEPISDSIVSFDMDANVTYKKNLKINIPEDLSEGDYRLRLMITDATSDTYNVDYNIKVDVPRHKLKIEDIVLYPGSVVDAGKALLTTVRVDNKGEKDQDDVKVIVTIPGLGLRGTDYINEIETNEEEETEEIFLRIPECAEGTFELLVDVEYDNGHEKESKNRAIQIVSDCKDSSEKSDDSDVESVVVVVDKTQEEMPPRTNMRSILEVVLIVLLIVLVIIGLLVGISKLKDKE